MTCDGCNKKPKFMLYEQHAPHCQDCYNEALEGCTVPFLVMTYDAWKEMKRNERQSEVA